jgi:hypothetical protein
MHMSIESVHPNGKRTKYQHTTTLQYQAPLIQTINHKTMKPHKPAHSTRIHEYTHNYTDSGRCNQPTKLLTHMNYSTTQFRPSHKLADVVDPE